MSIRRSKKESKFLQISNEVCQDMRISARGLGVLVRLLSRPEDWTTNSSKLSQEFNMGRDQMLSILKELSSLGYLILEKTRTKEGRFKSEWVVFDMPQPVGDAEYETESIFPTPADPDTVSHVLGDPCSGKALPIKKTDQQKHITKTEDINKDQSTGVDPAFDTFWSAYPKKGNKVPARKAFAAKVKTPATLERVMTRLKERRGFRSLDMAFMPDASTWLNQERWEEDYMPEPEKDGPQTLAEWLASIKLRGESAIGAESEVYRYAETVGLPDDFIVLAWQTFKDYHMANRSKNTDWRMAFLNSVKSGGYGLWAINSANEYYLTTKGKQALLERTNG